MTTVTGLAGHFLAAFASVWVMDHADAPGCSAFVRGRPRGRLDGGAVVFSDRSGVSNSRSEE
jgi:hypothetical protein